MFNIQPNTLYFVSIIYFFWAATAFDIFGTDNATYMWFPISISANIHYIIFTDGYTTVRFFSGRNNICLFLKNVENIVWFPKQYLLGFFILEKQLANMSDRGFLFLRNTLLLYSLLLWLES